MKEVDTNQYLIPNTKYMNNKENTANLRKHQKIFMENPHFENTS